MRRGEKKRVSNFKGRGLLLSAKKLKKQTGSGFLPGVDAG